MMATQRISLGNDQELQLPQAKQAAFFLDFDGTLVDIAQTPEAIIIPQDLNPLLERLQQKLQGALAIITGRNISSIQKFLRVPMPIAGLHGMEIFAPFLEELRSCQQQNSPPFRYETQAPLKALFTEAKAWIKKQTKDFPALLIEDKGAALCLHYRKDPRLQEKAYSLAQCALQTCAETGERLEKYYTLQQGHKVIEILPRTAQKGHALEYFMQFSPFKGRLPIAFGDDVTDQSMFAMATKFSGSSVSIGPKTKAAQQCLATPSLLRQCLWKYCL